MVSQNAIAQATGLIQSFESCRLKSYLDMTSKWTCGWGETEGVDENTEWTQDEADERLARRVEEFADGVDRAVDVDLADHQAAALICFSYNVGLQNFKSSTLLRLLNGGDYASVPAQLIRWDKVNGEEVPGLLRRRQAEADMWNTADG